MDMPCHDGSSPVRRASGASQFAAVLRKNLLLQLRGRRRLFGLAGWPALVLEVCVPALFFLVACIPKYYLKPQLLPLQLSPVYDLDLPAWGLEYGGPAAGSPSGARILFAPNASAHVARLALLLAAAAACPLDPGKKQPSGSGFYRYFPIPDAPPACLDTTYCRTHKECHAPLLGAQLVGRASAAEAVAEAVAAPETVDAVIDFTAWDAPRGSDRDVAWEPQGGGNMAGAGQTDEAGGRAPEVGADGRLQRRVAGTAAWRQAQAQAQQQKQQREPEQGMGGAVGGAGGSVFRYTIRMNHTQVPFTRMLLNNFDLAPGSQYKQQWFFANLQALVDSAILALAAADVACANGAPRCGGDAPPPALLPLAPSFKPFPWPAIMVDLGAAAAALFFTMLMTYAFLMPTRAVVGAVVQEKELLLREGMRILGLQDAAYWASWALTHWAMMAVSGLLCALVGLYPFCHSSFSLMLAFYWLLFAALLGFAYCASTLFASARVAGTAAAMLYALAMMPGWLVPSIQPYGGAGWAAACLLPPSAISLFAHVLVRQESSARGLTWASLWQPVTVEGSFSAATVYGMLAVDVVMPSQSAQTWPPYFPLLPSYWRRLWGGAGGRRAARTERGGDGEFQAGGSASPAIDIRRLTKVFSTTDGGEKVAVDDLSLDIRDREITGLLGHNGAGKTTAIGVITGLLRPTAGDVYVSGLSVRSRMADIRASLGVCPQFDVLWPDITVRRGQLLFGFEHLELAAALKGFPASERAAVAAAAAREVGLAEKLAAPAGQLSGGQRRKLSVALAFVGSPRVVILDEPTSGMDPYTRRLAWDVIRVRRGGSAILLTTHSMEEADMLSDRIAIMAEGRLAALGTSLDLKSQFGAGYTLTIARAGVSRATSEPSLASLPAGPAAAGTAVGGGSGNGGAPFNSPAVGAAADLAAATAQRSSGAAASAGDTSAAALLAAVREHVPSAQLLAASAGDVSIRLPKEASAAFPSLLRRLEQQRQELGVGSHGLSVTTLEEVFLRVTAGAAADAAATAGGAAAGGTPARVDGGRECGAARGPASAAATAHGAKGWQELVTQRRQQREDVDIIVACAPPSLCLRGLALWRQQCAALFAKRALSAMRDRTAALVQVLVPVLLVLLALWGGRTGARFEHQPPLELARATSLAGRAAVMAASPAVRTNGSAALEALVAAYPAEELRDSGCSAILRIPYLQPLAGTVDEYLLSSWNDEASHTYDALFLDSLPDLASLARGGNASALAAAPPLRYTLLANQTAVHGLPTSLSAAHSALLRWVTGATGARIAPSSQPLPVVRGELEQRVSQASSTLLLVLFVTMAAAILAASFAVFLVRERDCRSKAVQVIAGVSPSAFWAATLAWDLLHFSVPAAGMLAAFPLCHLPQFAGVRLAGVAALLWAFAPAALLQTYLLQWLFTDEMKAMQRITTLYFCTGFLGFLSTWMLDLIYRFLHQPSVHRTSLILKGILQLLSPHFCLCQGLYEDMATYKEDKGQLNGNPFAWDATGTYLASLGVQVVLYGALVLIAESGWLSRTYHRVVRRWAGAASEPASAHEARQLLLAHADGQPAGAGAEAPGEDDDVREERLAVQAGAVGPSTAAALLQGVHKTYWQGRTPVRAVRGLCLGMGASSSAAEAAAMVRPLPAVSHRDSGSPTPAAAPPRGECFGLLGVNGAGKTTSFSMLTGEVLPDAGQAYVEGHSLLRDPLAAHRETGYCPQYSALPPALTGREVLRMYARLRGLHPRFVEWEVQKLLEQMALSEFANRTCGSYSGGNKRKLSVAVALIGRNSGVVCLDEPSTGVDVGARRALWEAIQAEQRAQKTVVLTTHRRAAPAARGWGAAGAPEGRRRWPLGSLMEECEAVCSRVGVMAAGTLRALGSVQHLKARFGEGYLLQLRAEPARTADAEALVRRLCAGAALRECDAEGGHLAFAVPRAGLDLPALFEGVERGRAEGCVEEYSLSQTSLEQVFLHLAQAPGAGRG
eukprot:scaffold29.g5937.t1